MHLTVIRLFYEESKDSSKRRPRSDVLLMRRLRGTEDERLISGDKGIAHDNWMRYNAINDARVLLLLKS